MTTNHPAHSPVPLERLHQIREILSKAAAQSDGGIRIRMLITGM